MEWSPAKGGIRKGRITDDDAPAKETRLADPLLDLIFDVKWSAILDAAAGSDHGL
jgi:hypothetical protein